MAYPTVSGPYGLIPINLIGGQVFAGATRQIPIATNSSTAIFFGDVVKLGTGGTLLKDVGTSAATPVGVFLGCTYTDPTFGLTFRQFYAATTNITDIVAYVQDDPDVLFKVAVVSTGSTISYVNRTAVGENAVLIQTTGSTITGNSAVSISSTTATTSTFPIRIIDVINETESAVGSYTEVIVKWNEPSSGTTGGHQYRQATGI
jgi:methylglyoxal synthase